MLGAKEKLMWKQTDKGLEVTFPRNVPVIFAYVLKLRY